MKSLSISVNYASISGRVTDPPDSCAHKNLAPKSGNSATLGFDFLNVNARLSRVFPIRERLQIEGIAEAFNLLNHLNGVSLNGTFGTGTYPSNPLPTFKQITAVADPRTLQLTLRLRF